MREVVYRVPDRTDQPERMITVAQGDITTQKVDAVVNAANARLAGGAGVDGAIHRAGGPAIMEECRAIMAKRGGPLVKGEAVATTAGNMPAKHVIHTAGPVYHGGHGGEEEHLRECYAKSLALAKELGAQSVAFPAISCGVYRYPFADGVQAGLEEMRRFLESGDAGWRMEVRFVFFTRDQYERAVAVARHLFGSGSS